MASTDRFLIARAPAGGVSLGWTAYSTFRECKREAQLAYGDGLRKRGQAYEENKHYGSLFHSGMRAQILGKPLDSAFQVVLDEYHADAADLAPLLHEVQRDLAWFTERERGLMQVEVLLAEQQLTAAVGRHEMRGTIDLLARLPEYANTVAVLDWKSVDAYRGSDSRAYERARLSGQMTFYMALLGLSMPHLATQDGLIVQVPRFAVRTLEHIQSGKFKGKTRPDDIKPRFVWVTRTRAQLDEIVSEFTEACDEIERRLGKAEAWPRTLSACFKAWGKCTFVEVCHTTPATRAQTITDLYEQRPR